MITKEMLSSMLAVAGVKNLSVKFDAAKQLIAASFTYRGVECQKTIPFAELEDYLTVSPGRASTARRIDKNEDVG